MKKAVFNSLLASFLLGTTVPSIAITTINDTPIEEFVASSGGRATMEGNFSGPGIVVHTEEGKLSYSHISESSCSFMDLNRFLRNAPSRIKARTVDTDSLRNVQSFQNEIVTAPADLHIIGPKVSYGPNTFFQFQGKLFIEPPLGFSSPIQQIIVEKSPLFSGVKIAGTIDFSDPNIFLSTEIPQGVLFLGAKEVSLIFNQDYFPKSSLPQTPPAIQDKKADFSPITVVLPNGNEISRLAPRQFIINKANISARIVNYNGLHFSEDQTEEQFLAEIRRYYGGIKEIIRHKSVS